MYQPPTPWPGPGFQDDQHGHGVDAEARDAVAALIATEDSANKAWLTSVRRGWGLAGAVWGYALLLLLLGVTPQSLTFGVVTAAAAGVFCGHVAGQLATGRLIARSKAEARADGRRRRAERDR